LAQNAVAVIALGTCAAYGGIPKAKGSVTGAMGTWEFLNANGMNPLLVNVPGCPPHPDWFVATAGAALLELNGVIPGMLTDHLNTSLDHLGRPKNTYTGIYHNDSNYVFCQDCPRSSTKPGPVQPGPMQTSLEACRRKGGQPDGQCLENNGCNGYLAGPKFVRADCPTRKWNNHTNWPVGNNFPCSGCTDPGFPDNNSPFYKRTKNP
jgi:hydrogenase small subunit